MDQIYQRNTNQPWFAWIRVKYNPVFWKASRLNFHYFDSCERHGVLRLGYGITNTNLSDDDYNALKACLLETNINRIPDIIEGVESHLYEIFGIVSWCNSDNVGDHYCINTLPSRLILNTCYSRLNGLKSIIKRLTIFPECNSSRKSQSLCRWQTWYQFCYMSIMH